VKQLRDAVNAELAAEEGVAHDTAVGDEGSNTNQGDNGVNDGSDASVSEHDDRLKHDPCACRIMSIFLRLSTPLVYFIHTETFRSAIAPLIVTTRGGVDIMLYSPAEEARSPMHISSIVFSCITLAIICVVVPLAMLFVVLHGLTEKPMYSSRCSTGCSFLHTGYAAKTRWWLLLVMLKRVLLVVIVTVVNERPVIQSILCCVVCIVSLAGQAVLRPHKTHIEGVLSMLCETAVLVVSFAGILFWARDVHAEALLPVMTDRHESETSTWIIIFLTVIAAVAISLVCIRCVLSMKKVHALYQTAHKYVVGLLHTHIVSRVHEASHTAAHSTTNRDEEGNDGTNLNPLFVGGKKYEASDANNRHNLSENPMHDATYEYEAAVLGDKSSNNLVFIPRVGTHSRGSKEIVEDDASLPHHVLASNVYRSDRDAPRWNRRHSGGEESHYEGESSRGVEMVSIYSESESESESAGEEFEAQQIAQIAKQSELTIQTVDDIVDAGDHSVPPPLISPQEIVHPETAKRRRDSIMEFEAALASIQ
jgi:hypothetical protein